VGKDQIEHALSVGDSAPWCSNATAFKLLDSIEEKLIHVAQQANRSSRRKKGGVVGKKPRRLNGFGGTDTDKVRPEGSRGAPATRSWCL